MLSLLCALSNGWKFMFVFTWKQLKSLLLQFNRIKSLVPRVRSLIRLLSVGVELHQLFIGFLLIRVVVQVDWLFNWFTPLAAFLLEFNIWGQSWSIWSSHVVCLCDITFTDFIITEDNFGRPWIIHPVVLPFDKFLVIHLLCASLISHLVTIPTISAHNNCLWLVTFRQEVFWFCVYTLVVLMD